MDIRKYVSLSINKHIPRTRYVGPGVNVCHSEYSRQDRRSLGITFINYFTIPKKKGRSLKPFFSLCLPTGNMSTFLQVLIELREIVIDDDDIHRR